MQSTQLAQMAGDQLLNSEQLAAIAKALAHPARIQIIQLLLARQSCIGCEITDEVGLAQSTVSEHLRILKAAGIVTGALERPRVCYSLNATSLMPLAVLLNTVFAQESEDQLKGSICCAPASEPHITIPRGVQSS